jgi:hypothetical protein
MSALHRSDSVADAADLFRQHMGAMRRASAVFGKQARHTLRPAEPRVMAERDVRRSRAGHADPKRIPCPAS